MKTFASTENNKVASFSGKLEAVDFKIAGTAEFFDIISSKVYSNRILAPIRELCCNAYDAQVAANNVDARMEVHLPTDDEPIFSVRDFGTGLTVEQMNNLYTTYGQSSKTNTNDAIGCLGLGSKSPFAYADKFTVSSYIDGIRYDFIALKRGEKGVPQLCQVLPMDDNGNELPPAATDEPNGLKVEFAIKYEDVSKFQAEANKFFTTFYENVEHVGYVPTPTCRFTRKYDLSVRVDEKATCYPRYTYNSSWYTGSVYVIMGGVRYSIDMNSSGLDTDIQDAWQKMCNKIGMFYTLNIHMPIGSADISADREHISVNRATAINIMKVVNDSIDKIDNDVTEDIAEIEKTYNGTDYYVKCIQYLFTNSCWIGKRGDDIINKLNDKITSYFSPVNDILKYDLSGKSITHYYWNRGVLKREPRSASFVARLDTDYTEHAMRYNDVTGLLFPNNRKVAVVEAEVESHVRQKSGKVVETIRYNMSVNEHVDKDAKFGEIYLVTKAIADAFRSMGVTVFKYSDLVPIPKESRERTKISKTDIQKLLAGSWFYASAEIVYTSEGYKLSLYKSTDHRPSNFYSRVDELQNMVYVELDLCCDSGNVLLPENYQKMLDGCTYADRQTLKATIWRLFQAYLGGNFKLIIVSKPCAERLKKAGVGRPIEDVLKTITTAKVNKTKLTKYLYDVAVAGYVRSVWAADDIRVNVPISTELIMKVCGNDETLTKQVLALINGRAAKTKVDQTLKVRGWATTIELDKQTAAWLMKIYNVGDDANNAVSADSLDRLSDILEEVYPFVNTYITGRVYIKDKDTLQRIYDYVEMVNEKYVKKYIKENF